MRKGTVLSIENDVAIVFTDDCGLIRVPCRPDMAIGREIVLADRAVEPVHRAATRIRFWKPAMAAAFLLLVVTAGLWFGQGRWPLAAYARISMEVNPGIELVLDRRLQVREVQLFDDESRQLAAGVPLEGLLWREAIEQWTLVLIEKRPEKVERMLLGATLSRRDEAFLAQLRELAGTANPGALAGVEVRVLYTTDPDVARLAKINGLSVGRQMVLNISLDQQLGWGVDQMATAPMNDLVDRMPVDADPDQDPVMARIRERNVTRSSSGESSGTQTSGSDGQTTGKSSAEQTTAGSASGGNTTGQTSTGMTSGSQTSAAVTSGGSTSGQTSGKMTENSTVNSPGEGGPTGESTPGASTVKESLASQTTATTPGKTTSGSGTAP